MTVGWDLDEIRRLEADHRQRCEQLGIPPSAYEPWIHDPWPEPQPLTAQPEDPPAFPTDALPIWVADQADNIAHTTQTPTDLAVICQLGTLSTVAMWKRARIQLHGTWQEPGNLYLLAVLNSGEGKSPAMKRAIAPLQQLLAAEVAEWEAEHSERYAQLVAARADLDRAEKELKQQPKDAVALANVAEAHARLKDLEQHEHKPQPIANDITPEAMIDALAANGERLAILDTEPGIFDLAARYAGKDQPPNITLALKAHSGDPVELRRRGTGTASLTAPHITMVIMAQPIAVQRVYADREMRERGLAARLLIAEPATMVGRRTQRTHVNDDHAEAAWAAGVTSMWHRTTDKPVELDGRADEAFLGWLDDIEDRLDPYDGDLRHVAAFVSKLRSAVGRLALILHWAEAGDGVVNVDQMGRAIRIADYFLEHHLRRVGPVDDDTLPGVEETAEWLRGRAGQIVTLTDMRRGPRAVRDSSVGDTIEIVDKLIVHGWLRPDSWEWEDRVGGRGTRAPRFAVSPKVAKRRDLKRATSGAFQTFQTEIHRMSNAPNAPEEGLKRAKRASGGSETRQMSNAHKTCRENTSSSTESSEQPLSVISSTGPLQPGAFGAFQTQDVTSDHAEWPRPQRPEPIDNQLY